MMSEWQIALSKAVEELQHLKPLELTRQERQLVTIYIRQAEQALSKIEGRCPDCHTLPGGRHYCEKFGHRTFDEIGIPEGDQRRNLSYA